MSDIPIGAGATGNPDPRDLGKRVTALEAALKNLATSKAVVGRAGVVGGSTSYYDDSGHVIAIIGTQPDGLIGFRTYHPDGRVLFESLGVGFGGLQYSAMRDGFGNAMVADDFFGGLNRPRLTMGQWVPNAPMGGTPLAPTSSTYVTVEMAEVVVQAPAIRINVLGSSSTATATGNVRVINGSGDVIMAPTAVPVNAVTPIRLQPFLLPASSPFGTVETFLLQTNLTSGTGTVGARGLSIIGSASSDPE